MIYGCFAFTCRFTSSAGTRSVRSVVVAERLAEVVVVGIANALCDILYLDVGVEEKLFGALHANLQDVFIDAAAVA